MTAARTEFRIADTFTDSQADRLLGREVSDVDGNTDARTGTISVFNGPAPVVRVLTSVEEESATVSQWLAARVSEGVAPGEMSVFVRSAAEYSRVRAAVEAAGLPVTLLEADLEEVYDTERHLLYVSCTRARDHLLVTGVAPGSEFLNDLKGGSLR